MFEGVQHKRPHFSLAYLAPIGSRSDESTNITTDRFLLNL
jgi:hypothetical protein